MNALLWGSAIRKADVLNSERIPRSLLETAEIPQPGLRGVFNNNCSVWRLLL